VHRRTFSRVAPRRAKILFYIVSAIALALGWRLVDVQVLKGPIYAKQALAQRSDTVDVFARRGSILDRDGNVLAYSLPSESIYAVPHDIANAGKTIAQHLSLSPSTVKTHFENIYAKWGASDRSSAVAKGLREGVIE